MSYATDPTSLQQAACPLCQSEDRRRVHDFSPFAVVRCQACGFFYLSPCLPEAVAKSLYENDYFANEVRGYDNYAAQEPTLRAAFRRLLRQLQARRLTGGALLEVGCAYGYLLDEARGFFHTRVGTDYSAQAVAQSRPRADCVYHGGLEELDPAARFDCIIEVHVIEHIYQPAAFLKDLRARLKPGGSLVLVTPDAGSFWRTLLGRHWPFFKIPEHISYFTQASLMILLRQAGLSDVRPLPYAQAFPLPLICSKLGLSLPTALNRLSLWLPATTTAAYGLRRDGD